MLMAVYTHRGCGTMCPCNIGVDGNKVYREEGVLSMLRVS